MSNRRHAHIASRMIILVLLCCSTRPLYGETLPGKCRLVPANGSCKAMMEKYFFDRKNGRCTRYFYDGCGPVVPFDTLDECRSLCETVGSTGARPETTGVGRNGKSRSGLAHDPVEDDPRHAEVFKTIDDEVKGLLADHPQRGSEGFVNVYWRTKQGLLKRKYGIDWRSPGELNPHVLFD